MPAIAPAAFAMIRAETRLTPEMSTTEYIIVTSTAPTYGRVSPEATVETSSFGTPTGSARIARAAIDEPPEPPSARMPSRRPAPCSATDHRFGAGAHRRRPPRHDHPLPRARRCSPSPRAATSSRRDVGLDPDRLVDARVDDQHVDAVLRACGRAGRRTRSPLVSSVPSRTTVAIYARSASGSTPR